MSNETDDDKSSIDENEQHANNVNRSESSSSSQTISSIVHFLN
jgi:hypothetical protein